MAGSDKKDTDVPQGPPPPRMPAPDGGWGWFCVLGTSLAAMLQAVMVQAFGVLYLELLSQYKGTATATAWVGAINMVAVGLFSPVASALCNRFNERLVALVGGVLVGIGIVATAFAPNLAVVYVTFGLIAGSGCCIVVTTGYIVVSQYFDKRRAFAMSLTAIGPALGLLIFPTFMLKIYDFYGYTGATLILGGITINFCVAAALFRPLRECNLKLNKDNVNDDGAELKEKPALTEDEFKDSGDIKYKGSPIYKPNGHGSIAKDLECKEALLEQHGGKCEDDGKTNGNGSTKGAENSAALVSSVEVPKRPAKPTRPKVFDIRLMRKAAFVAMCFIYFNVSFSLGLGTAFLPAFAIQRGYDVRRAAFLLSVGGITAILGVLGIGVCLDFKKVRPYRVHLFNLCCFILALSNGLTPVCHTYAAFVITSAMRGISAAVLMTQRATVACDLVGPMRVPSAYALLTFASALGSLIRPLGGIFRDRVGSYDGSFYISGGTTLLSCIIFQITYVLNKRRRQMKENTPTDTAA